MRDDPFGPLSEDANVREGWHMKYPDAKSRAPSTCPKCGSHIPYIPNAAGLALCEDCGLRVTPCSYRAWQERQHT